MPKALLIGNSDGIGLAVTRELLKRDYEVIGVSRSDSPLADTSYTHHRLEVQDAAYKDRLGSILAGWPDLDICIYCAGIGELLDPSSMRGEEEVFEVNLMGMIKTASCVIPAMVGIQQHYPTKSGSPPSRG